MEEHPVLQTRYILVFFLMVLALVVNVVGLYSRMVLGTAIADVVLGVAGYFLLSDRRGALGTLFRSLFQWGCYWLALGLVFEAYEGGIKKDHPTMSYYFVTTGLAIFAYIAFSILIDHFKKSRYLRIVIENGQNPMIAYIAGGTLILPILAITRLDSVLDLLSGAPWLGFLKGVIITSFVALATSFFTRRKMYWRT